MYNPHFRRFIKQLPSFIPVGKVRLVQTSSVQDEAPLAVSLLIVHPLLGEKVRYTASRPVPDVRGVGQPTCLFCRVLGVKDFSAFLQVKGPFWDLGHIVKIS